MPRKTARQNGDGNAPPVPTAPRVEVVPVDSLVEDPANVMNHPARSIEAIKGSLARFKQQKPLIVDSNNVVRAGNGTLRAARELGWSTIAVIRSDLPPSELAAYSVADNRTAQHATWDEAALAETLRAFRSEGFDLDAVGFTAGELDDLFARTGAEMVRDAPAGDPVEDPGGEWKGMPEFEGEDRRPAAQLTVYFGSEADKGRFGELIGQPLTGRTKWVWYPPRKSLSGVRYVEDNAPHEHEG